VRCRRRRGGAGRRPRARQGAQDRGVLLHPRVRVGLAKYVASRLLWGGWAPRFQLLSLYSYFGRLYLYEGTKAWDM
jgi:hypothetical protein